MSALSHRQNYFQAVENRGRILFLHAFGVLQIPTIALRRVRRGCDASAGERQVAGLHKPKLQSHRGIKTGPKAMPAFEKKLSQSEIEALVAYVRAFGPAQ
jgi:hypothetical protein